MSKAANALLVEHKANKALTAALTELFEQYSATVKSDTIQREKHIKVDGKDYTWCNRHEIYEPSTNFKDDKKSTVACKLASTHWFYLGKEIKALEDKLMRDAMAGENVSEIAKQIVEMKEIRGGRYDFEANKLQHPDIEDYIYDEEMFITEGNA